MGEYSKGKVTRTVRLQYTNRGAKERQQGVKEQAGIDLISKETLEHGHCYLDLHPTVDIAMIPLLSHPVLRTKSNA